jgi:hypothetical protein
MLHRQQQWQHQHQHQQQQQQQERGRRTSSKPLQAAAMMLQKHGSCCSS